MARSRQKTRHGRGRQGKTDGRAKRMKTERENRRQRSRAREEESYICVGPGSARGLGPETTTMRVGPAGDESRRAKERQLMVKAGMAPHIGTGRWGEAE